MSFTDLLSASISRTELSSSLKYGSSMVTARGGGGIELPLLPVLFLAALLGCMCIGRLGGDG